MHTLFNDTHLTAGTVTTPASFKMTRRRVRKNLIDIIKHNRKQSYAVRSNHLLVRLIHTMNLDVDLPLFEYHRMAENRADRVATAHRLTHTKHRGDVKTDDVFYGKGTDEVVIAVNENIDLLSIEHTWRSLQPVKILAHPYNDLSLIPLDGSREGKFNAFAVIQIDIVALVMQYRMWVMDQLNRGKAIIRTPMQFVNQFPLTNALASHFDVAMQNRLMSLFLGEATEKFENPWPIYIRDLTQEVDDYLFDRIRYLKRRSMMYADILKAVPIAVKDDLWALNQLPKIPATRQITWALNMARAPILRFLTQLDYSVGGQRNFQDTNRIARSLRNMEYDREMMVALPPGQYDDVLDWFKREIGAYL